MKTELRNLYFPRAQLYTKEYAFKRVNWLMRKTRNRLHHIAQFSEDPKKMKGNIENFIGIAQVPLGIIGPLKMNGEYAQGHFYVPFATTEGALLKSYHRGALLLTEAGGVNVFTLKDEIHISPVFLLADIESAKSFILWVNNNFLKIKERAEKTTTHGKLIKITPYLLGRRVILNFAYFTGDAMGMNMINVATDVACKFVLKKTGVQKYFLRSNLSSDKKPAFSNFIMGYGKEVVAEATLPRLIVEKYLNVTPEDFYEFCYSSLLASIQAGMIGINAQCANALAAIFIACGQDVAQVVNAVAGLSMCEITKKGDLYVALRMPNLVVGTVGGGTALGTQRECLNILGCYGSGKAKKFAEIVTATLLAGEISIAAALTTGEFIKAHVEVRKHTKRKE
ncbi:MAG: hydroxymethylglutaryl-CoA reductase [Candidatus Omnitrophica bacterium]|nr:hydroxymethylglutaryl-CoA reductase [Candidatus Omnitrophota bacterium]